MALPHAALSSASTGLAGTTFNSGILVLDANSRAVSWNYEFLQIMSYPKFPSRLTDLHHVAATIILLGST